MVRENLIKVQQKIDEACERSGRDPKEVTLIAVSKTKPIEMIEEAIDAGKTQFGENKAQEMKEKYEALPKNLEWHFIGHLQTALHTPGMDASPLTSAYSAYHQESYSLLPSDAP